jgi:hypothetical protein
MKNWGQGCAEWAKIKPCRPKLVAEKAQALARWAEYLLAIVEGRESNVVPMQATS